MSKVLYWDFDGTLSYPNKSFFTALHWAVCNNGYTLNEDETINFTKTVYSWKAPQIAYPDRINALWWDSLFQKVRDFLLAHAVLPADIDPICSDFRAKLIDVSNYKLYSDTTETLQACIRMGYKNYLVTNNYPEILDNLKKLRIAHYFTDFIVSSHIGYEKPRKEFFAYAKAISGDPQISYMIGDNPVADIQGGNEAGLTTIAVHECKRSDAKYYFENLNEILSILP